MLGRVRVLSDRLLAAGDRACGAVRSRSVCVCVRGVRERSRICEFLPNSASSGVLFSDDLVGRYGLRNACFLFIYEVIIALDKCTYI